MFNQKNRRTCLTAINGYYDGDVALLAERKQNGIYWSIWSYGDRCLIEAILQRSEVYLNEFQKIG